MAPSSSPLRSKILPTRGAAKKASVHFSSQLASSEEDDDEENRVIRPKKRKRKSSHEPAASKAPSSSSQIRTNAVSTVNRKQSRAASHISLSSDTSDCDELTSSGPSNFAAKSPFTIAAPLLAKETWSIGARDGHVLVLLDEEARVFNKGGEDKSQYIWWPCKVVLHDQDTGFIKVSPYGSLTSSMKDIQITDPSVHNIVTFVDRSNALRFPNPPKPTIIPVRKKFKRDIESLDQRWKLAVEQAVDEIYVNYDGLPDVNFALSSSAYRASRTNDSQDIVSVIAESSEAPEPEQEQETIESGELVYAKEKSNSVYWPARVLSYVPPVDGQKKGKYHVHYIDDTRKQIPRTWFYTYEDDGFGLCQVGKWESAAEDLEDDADGQDDVAPHARGPSPGPPLSSPSPSEFGDLTLREQFAYVKPILQAILHDTYGPTKALNAQFMAGGKARQKLQEDAGRQGTMTNQDVHDLGKYLHEWCLRPSGARSTKDSEEIASEAPVTSNEDRQPSPTSTVVPSSPPAPPPSSFVSYTTDFQSDPVDCDAILSETVDVIISDTPQMGCEAYELLNGLEKIDYCLNVLLIEAKRQVLLWRTGHRTTIDILSDEEERSLWQKGSELFDERDWVLKFKSLRAMKEQQLVKENKLKETRRDESVSSRAARAAARA